MGITNSTLIIQNGEVAFVPAGTTGSGEVTVAGTTSSFVIHITGSNATASTLLAEQDAGTGSYFSFRSPASQSYKIWFQSSSGQGFEPSASNGLANYTGTPPGATHNSIKVQLKSTDMGYTIAEKIKSRLEGIPNFHRNFTVSCSHNHTLCNWKDYDATDSAYLYIHTKYNGSQSFNDPENNSFDLSSVFVSQSGGPGACTWQSQSGDCGYDTGSGLYPGIITQGSANIASASMTIGISGSDNSFVIRTKTNDPNITTSSLYFSSSGLIGMNTNDPKRAFDIEDTTPGESQLAIKKSKASDETPRWVAGDEVGKLIFIAQSSSYSEEATGSLAAVKAIVKSVGGDNSLSGELRFNTWIGLEEFSAMQVAYGAAASDATAVGVNFNSCISMSGNNANFADFTTFRGKYERATGDHVNYGTGAGLATSAGEGSGDIIKTGTGTTVKGYIYYLNNSNAWNLTDADATSTSTGLIAVALGTAPTHGMLLRGFVKLAVDNGGDRGAPYYLADTATGNGEGTPTAPGSSHVVRIIGYQIGTTGEIYFNPDHTWVER